MKIGVMASGGLGYLCFKHLLNSENEIECILTDSLSVPIIELAEKRGVACFKGNPRRGKVSEFIKSYEIDLLVSINYLFLVEDDIIQWPKKNAVNFHGSLLPKYRGRTPHVWAIINGEKKSGVTGHTLVKDCDAGDILIQKEIEIAEDSTGGDLLEEFNRLYPLMLDELLLKISSNSLLPIKQDESKATYFGKRTPEDGQIDWNWGALKIRNWVRAQAYPYPGAFTFYDGNKITIDKVAIIEEDFDSTLENGVIISVSPLLAVKVFDAVLSIESLRDAERYNFKKGDKFSAKIENKS